MDPRTSAVRRRVAAGLAVAALAMLAGSVPSAVAAQDGESFGIPADQARSIAEEILEDPRFTSRQQETIFSRIGRAITGFIRRIIEWFNRVVLGVGDDSPGGRFLFWGIVAVATVAGAAVIAARLARRRSEAAAARRAIADPAGPKMTAEMLERRADEAATEGRHETAIRLYYQAGLIRLGERGVIDYHPSLTSGEVADRLRLAVFDHIAGTFDSIAYGHRPAGPDDTATSRTEWRTLLSGADQ